MNKVEKMYTLAHDMVKQYERKNKDYGDSFGESFKEFGMMGALQRIGDKYNRAKQLASTNTQEVKDESMRDTLVDLATYALMTVIELDNKEKENKKVEKKDKRITLTTKQDVLDMLDTFTKDTLRKHGSKETVEMLEILDRRERMEKKLKQLDAPKELIGTMLGDSIVNLNTIKLTHIQDVCRFEGEADEYMADTLREIAIQGTLELLLQ